MVNFEKNGRYGKEFVFDQWEEVLPTELHKMILFLGSKVIKGIGPSLAQSIVTKFKEKNIWYFRFSFRRIINST